MRFSAELAGIRFGCGLSPEVAPPATPQQMLQQLAGPDVMAAAYPIPAFGSLLDEARAYQQLRKARRRARGTDGFKAAARAVRKARRQAAQQQAGWHAQALLRWTWTEDGLRERLFGFWSDHFTARGKTGILQMYAAPYAESAIRPHLAGRFEDLLIAAVMHPLMLHYLDQNRSVGPNSRVGRKRGRDAGVNENLAREVLELHTLGVGAGYSQADVRQLAELFTGLSADLKQGFRFRKEIAEPGAEQVLGKAYGGDPAGLEPIRAVLRDLAAHPATAQHLARKLAVHFVADDPDADLVAHVAQAWQQSGGDLMAVYAALLEHPGAWTPGLGNIKPPVDFMGSACRALAVRPEHLAALKMKHLRQLLVGPLAYMGQPLQQPAGPDGWPEEDAAWITPQSLAARLRWAMAAPERLVAALPEPEGFARAALGSHAGARVQFAARSAETRAEAVGLVLSAPAFHRR
jgi:uncharacterized protein (DUF1800 family)